MIYCLDANICIFFLRGNYPALLETILSHAPDAIKIPSIVAAELMYGAEKSAAPARNIKQVEKFLIPFEIITFDMIAARMYATIRSSLEREGKIIGPNDLIIAATVLSKNGTLITNNIKEFLRVENLPVEDWTLDC